MKNFILPLFMLFFSGLYIYGQETQWSMYFDDNFFNVKTVRTEKEFRKSFRDLILSELKSNFPKDKEADIVELADMLTHFDKENFDELEIDYDNASIEWQDMTNAWNILTYENFENTRNFDTFKQYVKDMPWTCTIVGRIHYDAAKPKDVTWPYEDFLKLATDNSDDPLKQRFLFLLMFMDKNYRFAEALDKMMAEGEYKLHPWLNYLIKGCAHDRYAWNSRGGGYASDVTGKGWEGFYHHLDHSYEYLTQAHELYPDFPEAAKLLVKNCFVRNDKKKEGYEWLKKSVEAQIDCDVGFETISFYRLPRWGGTLDELRALGKLCLNNANSDNQLAAIGFNLIVCAAQDSFSYNPERGFEFDYYDKAMELMDQMEKMGRQVRLRNLLPILRFHLMMSYGRFDDVLKLAKEIDPQFYNTNHNKWYIAGIKSSFPWYYMPEFISMSDSKHRDFFFDMQRKHRNPDSKREINRALLAFLEKDSLSETDRIHALNLLGKYNSDMYTSYVRGDRDAIFSLTFNNGSNDHTGLIKKLLSLGYPVNKKTLTAEGKPDRSLLSVAAEYSTLALVKILLDCNAEINDLSASNETPVMYSITGKKFDITSFLIEKGVEINTVNIYGRNMLHYFSRADKGPTAFQCFKTLVEKGVNPNLEDRNGYTPLYTAASDMDEPRVNLLLDVGAKPIQPRNDYGLLAKFIQAEFSMKTIKKLLDKIEDVNAYSTDMYGRPLITQAVMGNSLETTEILIKRGAELDKDDNQGNTALMLAGYFFKDIVVIETLIKHGANVNFQNGYKWTALHYAAQKGNMEAIKLFIKHGADVNMLTDANQTAYDIALENKHQEIADYLKSVMDAK